MAQLIRQLQIDDLDITADIDALSGTLSNDIDAVSGALSTEIDNEIAALSGTMDLSIDNASGAIVIESSGISADLDAALSGIISTEIDNDVAALSGTMDISIAESSGTLSSEIDSDIGALSGTLVTDQTYYTPTIVSGTFVGDMTASGSIITAIDPSSLLYIDLTKKLTAIPGVAFTSEGVLVIGNNPASGDASMVLGGNMLISTDDTETKMTVNNFAASGDARINLSKAGTVKAGIRVDDGDGDKYKIDIAGIDMFEMQNNFWWLNHSGTVRKDQATATNIRIANESDEAGAVSLLNAFCDVDHQIFFQQSASGTPMNVGGVTDLGMGRMAFKSENGAVLGALDEAPVYFMTDSQTQMRLGPSGRLGIGTGISPITHKLEVEQASILTASFKSSTGAANVLVDAAGVNESRLQLAQDSVVKATILADANNVIIKKGSTKGYTQIDGGSVILGTATQTTTGANCFVFDVYQAKSTANFNFTFGRELTNNAAYQVLFGLSDMDGTTFTHAGALVAASDSTATDMWLDNYGTTDSRLFFGKYGVASGVFGFDSSDGLVKIGKTALETNTVMTWDPSTQNTVAMGDFNVIGEDAQVNALSGTMDTSIATASGYSDLIYVKKDGSTPLPYGSMWIHEQEVTVVIAGVGDYTPVSGFTAGHLNAVTVDSSGTAFTVEHAGVYKIDWSLSGDSAGVNKNYEVDIFVDGVEQDEGSAKRDYGAVGSLGNYASPGLITCPAGCDVQLRVKNTDDGTDFDIFNGSVVITMVGGTT